MLQPSTDIYLSADGGRHHLSWPCNKAAVHCSLGSPVSRLRTAEKKNTPRHVQIAWELMVSHMDKEPA